MGKRRIRAAPGRFGLGTPIADWMDHLPMADRAFAERVP